MKKDSTPKIVEKTEFKLAHYDNVQRLVMALTLSGYFVKVIRENDAPYLIKVYTYENQK